MHLLQLPFPSLTSLAVYFTNRDRFRDALRSLPELSPSIRNLTLRTDRLDIAFSRVASSCICRWRNLQTLACDQITLDMDALTHLSRMPTLTQLEFTSDPTLPTFDSPLFFPNLHSLTLWSGSLTSISQLLSQTRLPAIMEFTADTENCPSKRELSFFWASLQTSTVGHTIESFTLHQHFPSGDPFRPKVDLEDLRPCMAFSSLCHIMFDIEWNVDFTDSQLLALASACPSLADLCINEYSGWNTSGGITPNGLQQLLLKCLCLLSVSLALDTRGYTQLPANGLLASVGYTSPFFWLNVVDSIIEADSVPAVAAFLAGMPSLLVVLGTWLGGFLKPPGWEIYKERWDDVRGRIGSPVG